MCAYRCNTFLLQYFMFRAVMHITIITCYLLPGSITLTKVYSSRQCDIELGPRLCVGIGAYGIGQIAGKQLLRSGRFIIIYIISSTCCTFRATCLAPKPAFP
jgi:hypothetical protein